MLSVSEYHRKFVGYLQETTRKRDTNLEKLKKTVHRFVDQIPPKFVIKLYNSLPRRLKNIVKSKGSVIRCYM